jgi:hypothetical protein
MKKFILTILMLGASLGTMVPQAMAAYNFGDFRSETLVGKAWGALSEGDIEGVLAYTNKCLELYAEQAKKMQDSLSDYAAGSNDDVFAYWALNDVATSLFIQGEAYRKANMMDEAKESYTKITEDYKYGQTWDPQGWFWKPAEAAKDKLSMINSGSNLDFGDYTSSFLTTQAWKALLADDLKAVEAYTNKVSELYAEKAKNMQKDLTEYPWESKEKIFSYWALNDVGTSYYIQGEAYKKAGKAKEAKTAYQKLVDDYSYAQCWDPKGWFWKPAEAAVQAIDDLGDS